MWEERQRQLSSSKAELSSGGLSVMKGTKLKLSLEEFV